MALNFAAFEQLKEKTKKSFKEFTEGPSLLEKAGEVIEKQKFIPPGMKAALTLPGKLVKGERERLAALSPEEKKKELITGVVLAAPIGSIAKEVKLIPQLEEGFKYSVQKVFRRVLDNKALQKYGEEGKQIFNKIKKSENWAVAQKSEALIKLDKIIPKLNEQELASFADYVEKAEIPIKSTVRQAVNIWKEVAHDIANKSQEFGIKIKLPDGTKVPFTPRENYYPAFLKEEKLKEVLANQNSYNTLLEQMSKEGNITVAKAHDIIQDLINGRADFYGHLERARLAKLPKEFYERDPKKILGQYISEAYNRLGDAKEFGGDDSLLQGLIDNARKNGKDFEEIQLLTDRALGREKYNKALQNVSSYARMYNNVTKLSLAAVTNLGDITKSFVRTDFFPALKSIVQTFTVPGKEFAAKAGVLDTQLQQFAKEQGLGEKFFKYTGFKFTEKKLRQIQANAAKNYIEILYSKLKKNPDNPFLQRRLEQFGLDYKELLERGIKQSDYVEGAIQAVADTQPVSRVDIPYYWQSPTGKILTQYKTFAYKQWSFAKDFIFAEARRGNVKPLLSWLIVGVAVGETVGDLKAFVRGGRKRPDTIGRRIVDNLLTIGGIGLATDFLSNLQYGTMGGGLLKFIAGPTLSDLDSILTAIQGDVSTALSPEKEFVVGKVPKKMERQPKVLKKAIYSMPFLGPALSNKLFPTRSTYKARTIPIAEEILQMMEENEKRGGAPLNTSAFR